MKKSITERNEDDQEMPGKRCGGGPQEDEHPRFVSEDPRSAGLEEDCVGQGPYWTVAPDVVVTVAAVVVDASP
jgi:hypothetical protein